MVPAVMPHPPPLLAKPALHRGTSGPILPRPMDSSGKILSPVDSDPEVDEAPPSSSRLRAPAQIEEARARSPRFNCISPAETRAFVGKAETQRYIRSVVCRRLGPDAPEDLVDDLVQTANEEMLKATRGPRALTTARGWAAAVTRYTVVQYFRRKKAAAKWLLLDEDIEERPNVVAEPSGDLLIGPWLARAVEGTATDEETLEILLRRAETGKTLESIAEDFGMRPGTLRKRVFDFKHTYEPRWRRRQQTLMIVILLGAAAVAVAVWQLLRPAHYEIGPDPTPPVLSQAPAPKVVPTDTPFEPAQPPTVPRRMKLRNPPQNFDPKQ
jgi:RNA polymerase sigma factor (sigma-70 family)